MWLFRKKRRILSTVSDSDEVAKKRLFSGCYIPRYNSQEQQWGVENRRGIHLGDVGYIAHITSGAVLKYPCYYCGDHPDWAENFDQVLEALFRHPNEFSIAGHESYYSPQEQRFLACTQAALIKIKQTGCPLSAEEEAEIKSKYGKYF